jgi:hypothetical protein
VKHLEENLGETLPLISIGSKFLNKPPIAQEIGARTDK